MNADVAQGFVNVWSIYIGQDSVRVLLLILNEQQRQIQKDFYMKLVGFLYSTNAHNLRGVVEATGAKACFVPRNPKTYNYMNYAYVYFNSNQHLEKMTTQNYLLHDFKLSWTTLDMMTCYRCSELDHIAKDCELRFNHEKQTDPKLQ